VKTKPTSFIEAFQDLLFMLYFCGEVICTHTFLNVYEILVGICFLTMLKNKWVGLWLPSVPEIVNEPSQLLSFGHLKSHRLFIFWL